MWQVKPPGAIQSSKLDLRMKVVTETIEDKCDRCHNSVNYLTCLGAALFVLLLPGKQTRPFNRERPHLY